MNEKTKTVTVLGAGSWGTALAHHLTGCGSRVTLWGNDQNILQQIKTERKNRRFFGEALLAAGIYCEGDLSAAVKGASLIVVAVPSHAVRSVCADLRGKISSESIIVSTAKGLEEWSIKTMSQVIEEELGPVKKAVLSGPSFAKEVLLGLPTAVTMAAADLETCEQVAKYFRNDYFRVYTTTDVIGVEFGGAIKNVIAIASGVVDGVNLGANARAALITRGLSEMQKLVQALGGDPRTVSGLSGLGDLLLTSTGDLSRNRQVGIRLAKGETLEEIIKSLGQVAEGVATTHKILELANAKGVSMPIVEEIAKLLSGKTTAKGAALALLSRAPSSELLE